MLLKMKDLFKKIIEFFKNLFSKKEIEETIPIEDVNISTEGDSGTTEVENDDIDDNNIIVTYPTEPVEPEEDENECKIKILIDNGHGFDTPGKKSPYSCSGVEPAIIFEEWRWAREISHPLVDKLVELGYDAELLVPEREDISLKERVRRVNEFCLNLGKNNVILISVHANAAGNGTQWMKARGWEAYTTRGTTKSDKLADCLYAAAEKNFKGMKIRSDYSDGDIDKEADFYIIKHTLCPAVLTENFFYDNVDDVNYILSDEGREAVLKAHLEGIKKYLKK